MKINITEKDRERKRNNTQEKTSDAQRNRSPPTDQCQSSDLSHRPANSPVYTPSMMFYRKESPFGWFRSAATPLPALLHRSQTRGAGKPLVP